MSNTSPTEYISTINSVSFFYPYDDCVVCWVTLINFLVRHQPNIIVWGRLCNDRNLRRAIVLKLVLSGISKMVQGGGVKILKIAM